MCKAFSTLPSAGDCSFPDLMMKSYSRKCICVGQRDRGIQRGWHTSISGSLEAPLATSLSYSSNRAFKMLSISCKCDTVTAQWEREWRSDSSSNFETLGTEFVISTALLRLPILSSWIIEMGEVRETGKRAVKAREEKHCASGVSASTDEQAHPHCEPVGDEREIEMQHECIDTHTLTDPHAYIDLPNAFCPSYVITQTCTHTERERRGQWSKQLVSHESGAPQFSSIHSDDTIHTHINTLNSSLNASTIHRRSVAVFTDRVARKITSNVSAGSVLCMSNTVPSVGRVLMKSSEAYYTYGSESKRDVNTRWTKRQRCSDPVDTNCVDRKQDWEAF